MGKLKVMPPALRLISQAELRSFVALQNSLRIVQRFYNQRSTELLEILLAGAQVENGTHVAETITHSRGPWKESRLSVR